ncbi:MAG: hypothetical protein II966_04055, partial [Lachnospiraceae bacterium]|nr:hypothetical protein [Lachnospiraceae bacterium]
SEINNFAYYKASGGCARILQGNMPLSAAKIRRSKRQNEKSFVVYYNIDKKNLKSGFPTPFFTDFFPYVSVQGCEMGLGKRSFSPIYKS